MGLTLGGAIVETLGVGLIPAFVSLLINTKISRTVGIVNWAYRLTGLTDYKAFVHWAFFALMAVYVLKGFFLAGLSWLQGRFIYQKQQQVSQALFTSYLSQPYAFYLQHNSAELQRNLNVEVPNLFNEVLRDVMILVSEAWVALGVTLLLLVSEPLSTLAAVTVLGGATLGFYRLYRPRVGRWGERHQYHRGKLIQWVNQGLDSIQETKVLGREAYFLGQYRIHAIALGEMLEWLYVANRLPRLFVETIAALVLFLVLLLDFLQGRQARSLVLLLSLFAAGAFRLMIAMNRMVAAATTIRFHSHAVDVIYASLKAMPLGPTEWGWVARRGPKLIPRPFSASLEFDRVSYVYPEASQASLSQVSLRILPGEAIAIVGSSGAGKSTLMALLLGLLPPTQGQIRVDGVPVERDLAGWQSQIGYIPQMIYLADDTLRRNIAFGLADEVIEDGRVWEALRLAQLEGFVQGLPLGLETVVGERGVRLSGGQRQRIAIARALYADPAVLVMDEATAALDTETERGIVAAIEALMGKKTVVMIAHRLSTVKHCDRLYLLNQGQIVDMGRYDELLKRNPGFQNLV